MMILKTQVRHSPFQAADSGGRAAHACLEVHGKRRAAEGGSALVVTLILCAILGLLMGSYLYLVQNQQQAVARSQRWNQAMGVAEAGVDEAMALLNSGGFSLSTYASDGRWVVTSSNLTLKTPPNVAKEFGDSYYAVTISKVSLTNPVILATSYVPAPISTQMISRVIQVNAKPRPTFPFKSPMTVFTNFDGSGYNVVTDSITTNGTHSADGDIVTLSTNAGSIKIGNAKVNGNVRTPPGGIQGVTATIGSGGSVGDTYWVSNYTGFQTGHFRDDFILTPTDFPDVSAPIGSGSWGTPPSPPGANAPDGLHYDYVLSSLTPNFQIGTLSGSVYVASPNSRLYVTTSISISGGSGGPSKAPPQIHIGPGASLTIYMAGATTTIAGNGLVNDTLDAKNFQYYGLPTNTGINLTGNGAFYGTIYAPEAVFNLKGSGSGTADDFTGTSLTLSTKMTGNFNFHYPDGLDQLTTIGGFDATSWTEL